MSGLGPSPARAVVAALALAVAAGGCAAPRYKRAPHDQQFQRVVEPTLHEAPVQLKPTDWWDHFLFSTVSPAARLVSPATWVGWLVGGRKALDVNAFGEVPDSPWFENRVGRGGFTAEDMFRGPATEGPPADGPLTVVSGKPEGVSPGVVARDAAGALWFVKFDPPAYLDLTTGAEVVAQRILHAAGYHVPETYLITIDLERLRLAPGATTRDEYGRDKPLTQKALSVLLLQLNPNRDGRLRAFFSRAVPGRPLGPFSYRGARLDDPNDTIVHERRRSLRGLWLFSAWLNNTDTRNQNTIDTFIPVGDQDQGYVRHYLLDFGDSLGASGDREKKRSEGYQPRVPWRQMGIRTLALGFLYPYWLPTQRSQFRSVGMYESTYFDPGRWAPEFPNPAFEEATVRDTFWAATIAARMGPELLAAAVDAGQYREPGAARYLRQQLLARRNKILAMAFDRMPALVDPRVADGYRVELDDLEKRARLLVGKEPSYEWQVRWNRTGAVDPVLGQGEADAPVVDLRSIVTEIMNNRASDFVEDPYLTLSWWRRTGPERRRSARMDLYLRVVGRRVLPVGIYRETN